MAKHKIAIRKSSQRRLDVGVMRTQVRRVADRMMGGTRGKVWSVNPGPPSLIDETANGYLYACNLSVERIGRAVADDVAQKQMAYMIQMGQGAANSSGWVFPDTSGSESEAPQESATLTAELGESRETETTERGYSNVSPSTELGSHFEHIYDREAQVAVIHSAIKAFVDSDYANRFHAVLWGEPACGKTEILRSFSRMLGPDAVLELDATSTTKAGAERILLESAKLPPVLICEEIEKTDEHSLRWLLGILDHRGEVRKVTHGGGLRHRNVKMLCLATVNDMVLFKKVMDGALASRFSHKVYCPRPSKEVLRRILAREVDKVKGNPAWIDPAVDYCVDQEETNDPRRVVTVCLSGGDKLLTGEYQQLLEKVAAPK